MHYSACFNPRARTGRDGPALRAGLTFAGFNPRARTGRDVAAAKDKAITVFQSTRPHGARRTLAPIFRLLHRRFNPRARTGRDGLAQCISMQFYVSIHAPARGATGSRRRAVWGAGVSIHAPARGATAVQS